MTEGYRGSLPLSDGSWGPVGPPPWLRDRTDVPNVTDVSPSRLESAPKAHQMDREALVERMAEAMRPVYIPGRNSSAESIEYFRRLARAALAVVEAEQCAQAERHRALVTAARAVVEKPDGAVAHDVLRAALEALDAVYALPEVKP